MAISNLEFDPQVASTTSNYTINQFHKFQAAGSLVLRPPFQRNLVWNEEQQSFLVDSILRGLPVPEIYIHLTTTADGDETVVVVDGQQRIAACLQFLSGNLRLDAGQELDPRWRNRAFAELDPPLQQRFRSYELIGRKLPSLGEPVLREIFRRLNKTVEPLLPQELRHAAYTGPFIAFVEHAASQPILGEVGVFTARDFLRRRSDELMAEIALALAAGAYPNKKEGLDELFLGYEQHGVPAGILADLGMKFGRVFSQLDFIAGKIRRTRFRNKSDFYTLFVTLAKNAEVLPLDKEGSAALAGGLSAFGAMVDGLKQDEKAGRTAEELVTDDDERNAVKYMRAVERAASDRLSRVRRDEALLHVLGPLLAVGQPRELTPSDSAWQLEPVEADIDEDDDEDEDFDRRHAREVLEDGGSPAFQHHLSDGD